MREGSSDLSLASGVPHSPPSQPAHFLISLSAFQEAPPAGLTGGRSSNMLLRSPEPSPTAREGELSQKLRRPEA